ncbi:MAG TPA: DUF6265 family protein [bacterium]
MKTRWWLLFTLFCVLAFCRADAQQLAFSNLQAFEWLVGEWKSTGGKTTSCETWSRASDRTFEGEGYFLKNGEKVVTEYLRIELFGNEVYYVSRVSHNKYPVPFKLVKVDGQNVIFENTEHDFPQRIIYQRKEDGSLHARIEGQQDGKERGVDFFFVKSGESSK